MHPPHLLIYAKPPRIGLAKTRLARGLGRAGARRIASFTLSATLRAGRNSRLAVTLHVAPDSVSRAGRGDLAVAGFKLQPQGQGGLTERLARGYHAAPAGPVIFIGADAPDITPALLRKAVIALRRHDAVFGPARDGGFWLFGLHKRQGRDAPFSGVRWSGPHAMEDVWSRLPERARVAVLPMLIDLDEADDWWAWRDSRR